MKKIRLLINLFFITGVASANTTALEERLDFFERIVNLQVRFEMVQNSSFWSKDKKLNSMAFVDTLWDKSMDSEEDNDLKLVRNTLKGLDFNNFELADKVRLLLIDQKLGKHLILNSKFMQEVYSIARSGKLERREIYTLLNYEEELANLGFENIFKEIQDNYESDITPYTEAKNLQKRDLDKTAIKDIVFNNISLGDYNRGRYSFGPKLFMLCRHDRNYPCLMIMKDSRNQLVRNSDGSIWSQKALGLARRKRRYNVKNGFTPAGVYTMDSVMPSANKQRVYGKFRRVILNFIPRSTDEVTTKALLPSSSENESWWKQAVVARDVGRNLLRIHGTGLRNNNSSSSYYPFVKTSGCIAQRENSYDGKTYKDQRGLLDKMMQASAFTPNYANEVHIKGLLYVVEVNGRNAPMEFSDVKGFLDL